ncbi:MAG: DUF3795 domain-containing protein [Nitrososphaerota archaeon]|nr:DUF3795 domain-containing protein [Nitrososphaerota archaeon]
MNQDFNAELFARCGLNCRICVGFFGYTLSGEKQPPCGGCRTREKTCTFFKNNCKHPEQKAKIEYCFDCTVFPCENLTKIDQYYSQKYGPSIIESFTFIKTHGMDAFLKNEKEKWKCPTCGGVICVHTKKCYTCTP